MNRMTQEESKHSSMGLDWTKSQRIAMIERDRLTCQLVILRVLCSAVLCAILVAGLWPFHAPLNDVSWLKNESGLQFGPHGTVISSGTFPRSRSNATAPCSLEVGLEPRLGDDVSVILSFYTPEHAVPFAVYQAGPDMILEKRLQNRSAQVNLPNIFLSQAPLLLEVVSGVEGTRIYVDGTIRGWIGQFNVSANDCAGQLVLGTSPIVNKNWSGSLRELAIYHRELTDLEVARHSETWTAEHRFDFGREEHPLAAYRFDERQGRLAHDSSGTGVDLLIPERYMIVHEKLLEPPWSEFHDDWGYWKNVLINVGGFIPLGFVFCAYFSLKGRIQMPAWTTIILGAALSITIEVLQGYLPTRDSGTTDILTNTLGTCFGVMLYRWKANLLGDLLHRLWQIAFGKMPRNRRYGDFGWR